jgi:hypothetical protein
VRGDAAYIVPTVSTTEDYPSLNGQNRATSTVYMHRARSVMLIQHNATQNSATDPYNLLAIGFNQTNNLDTRAYYMSFLMPSTNTGIFPMVSGIVQYRPSVLAGGIQVSSDQGMWYASTQADYAEYLPKLNPAEAMAPGDIVGVVSGRVTHETTGAQHVMVLSSSPIIVGNWPGKDVSGYALTAFMGQVVVKVKGEVNPGDYIIPSGLSDGTGVAVSPKSLQKKDVALILGRALEGSAASDRIRPVKILIGFPYAAQKMGQYVREIRELEDRVNDLATFNDTLKKDYLEKLQDRQRLIEMLQKKAKLVKQT